MNFLVRTASNKLVSLTALEIYSNADIFVYKCKETGIYGVGEGISTAFDALRRGSRLYLDSLEADGIFDIFVENRSIDYEVLYEGIG